MSDDPKPPPPPNLVEALLPIVRCELAQACERIEQIVARVASSLTTKTARTPRMPTVAELRAFLLPATLADRLRALVTVWFGRAATYQEVVGDVSNRVTALARMDCWLRATQDLVRLLDQFEKEQAAKEPRERCCGTCAIWWREGIGCPHVGKYSEKGPPWENCRFWKSREGK